MASVRQHLERLTASLLGQRTRLPGDVKQVPTGYGIAQLVDSVSSLEHMLWALSGAKQLAVDAEGVNLGRSGKLCVLAISPAPASLPPRTASSPTTATTTTSAPTTAASGGPTGTNPTAQTAQTSPTTPPAPTPPPPPPPTVFLLDVSALSSKAFHHTPDGSVRVGGGEPRSLKSLLECGRVTKLFFDVRADAEALFHQHGVALRGVVDLQLAEVAYRRYGPAPRRVGYVMGLSRALESYLDSASRERWQATAVDKRSLAEGYSKDPQYWERRPLTEEQVRYASDDVIYLHHLHRELAGSLSPLVLERVMRFSEYRIADSQRPALQDEGVGTVAGPGGSLVMGLGRDASRALAPAGL